MMSNLSSLVALHVVDLATRGITSDDKVAIMITLGFSHMTDPCQQWLR